MRSLGWILKTEIRQSRWFFLIAGTVALISGISLGVGFYYSQQILQMTSLGDWNAELVILPKGLSLLDLQEEITSGISRSFLPEAIFDTTVSLTNGQMVLGAVLALQEQGEPFLLQKGEALGLVSETTSTRARPWREQTTYSTPEWGSHVISAFFAKGSRADLVRLKELVDRKTVGQALWVSAEKKRMRASRLDFWLS